MALEFQIELKFGDVVYLGEGKTGVPGEKTLKQNQPTYDAESANRTRATLVEACVGDKCSIIPAPQKMMMILS